MASEWISAVFFSGFCFVVICFHVALLFGAPWGHLTLGGRYDRVLPVKIRLVSAPSAILMSLFIVAVLARGGVAFQGLHRISRMAIWPVVGYCVLGVLLNSVSRSKWERILWVPVTLAMLVTGLIVAVS